jgi:hypothetical protein
MRLVFALAIVALGAVPAAAQQAGDRYGYGPAPRAPTAASAQPLENQGVRALTWASKTQPQAAAAAAAAADLPAAPPRPQSLALAGQYERRQAWTRDLPPPPSARPVARQASAYQPFVPQTPYFDRPQQVAALTPPAVRPATAPAPVPLRAAPAATAARADRGPSLAGAAPVAQPVAKPAQQVAQAAPHAGEGVHFYSLHRAYGLTPDAIPEPPPGQRYVLMGPPDPPRAKPAERDDDDNDDAPAGKPSRPF